MKKLVGILAVALLVTVAIGTKLWLQHRDHVARIAALQAQASVPQAKPPNPSAPADTEGLETLDTLVASPPSAQQRARSEALRVSQDRPEDRDLRRARLQLETLPWMYPDLAAELHLSPEEAQRLFELIATLQMEEMEAVRLAAGNADPASAIAQDGRRRMQAAPQRKAEQLTALLGSKYPQWLEYEKTATSRRQVKELQAVLSSGANALAPTQTRPLIAALAVEQERIDQELRQLAAAGIGPDEFRRKKFEAESRRLPEAASPHLTPAQLTRYQRMFARQGESEGPLSVLRSQKP